MKGYRFSLEKVLDWRNETEEQARKRLGDIQVRRQEEESVLERLLNESLKLKAEKIFSGNVDALRQQDLYQELMSQRIIRQKLVLEKTDSELEQAKAALIEAHKDKKVMEKLREKDYTSYRIKQDKDEQHQLDELSVLQYGRSMY